MKLVPSGEQFAIVHGEQRASIVEVGGGIRAYEVGQRGVLHPYPLEAICDGAHGAPLIPWPNRLEGGRYRFGGVDYQLPLTEPERGNAIHGLLRWRSWRAVESSPERVVVATTLHPQPGYPFALDLKIDYELGEQGLRVATSATNLGDSVCPYACGQHPYLSPGSGTLDECTLEFEAGERIVTDERGIPAGREPVAGGDFDFRGGRLIGQLQIDSGFTDLERDATGWARVTLTGSDGAAVELLADQSYSVIQLFTADTLAPARRRHGLAAEPMTAPANALRTGESLTRVAPGETVTSCWRVRLL